MAWYAVFESVSGALRSIAEAAAPPVVAGCEAKQYVTRPDQAGCWDVALKDFVAVPAPVQHDLVQELRDDPTLQTIWSRLTATQQTTLRNAIIAKFSAWRFQLENQ